MTYLYPCQPTQTPDENRKINMIRKQTNDYTGEPGTHSCVTPALGVTQLYTQGSGAVGGEMICA